MKPKSKVTPGVLLLVLVAAKGLVVTLTVGKEAHAVEAVSTTEGTGAAESASAAEGVAAARTAVQVNVVGELGKEQALLQLLGEWLAANQIEHQVVLRSRLQLSDLDATHGAGPPVKIWLVALGPRRVRLYFTEPDAERYLVRDVPVPSGYDEVGRERLVQVVLSSALAFLDREVGSSFSEVERALLASGDDESPAPEKSFPSETDPQDDRQTELETTRDTRDSMGFGAAILYGAASKSSEGFAHGPGMLLEVDTREGDRSLALRASAQFRWPRQVSTESVTLSLQEVVSAASLNLTLKPWDLSFLSLEAGGGWQWVHVDPSSVDATVASRAARWDSRPFLLLALGPAWRLGDGWLRVAARVDWQLTETRYDVHVDGIAETQTKVARLQPGVLLEWGTSFVRSFE